MQFEKASRLKLRFATNRGNVTTEDLWDLPLIGNNSVSLDHIAITLHRTIKEGGEESFVAKKSRINTVLELKLNIVKHIIKVKLDEVEVRENQATIKAKKEKILGIIADKEDENLKGESVDELKKMLADL